MTCYLLLIIEYDFMMVYKLSKIHGIVDILFELSIKNHSLISLIHSLMPLYFIFNLHGLQISITIYS